MGVGGGGPDPQTLPLDPPLEPGLRHQVAMLERCLSYRESNKRSKERQGPILGVNFTEVSLLTILFTIIMVDSNKANEKQ